MSTSTVRHRHRHRHVNTVRRVSDDPDYNPRLTTPEIRRLARRGGVKRIQGLVYEHADKAYQKFVEDIVKDAVLYTQHRRAHTVTVGDMLQALRHQNRALYGMGEPAHYGAPSITAKRRPNPPNPSPQGPLVPITPANPLRGAGSFVDDDEHSGHDPFFGNLTQLLGQLRVKTNAVREIQLLRGQTLLAQFGEWWKETEFIRKTDRGCPRLDPKRLLRSIQQDDTYAIYNVRGDKPRGKTEGILAFLVLKRTPDGTAEIDYACSFERVPGIMGTLVKALKTRHRRIYLKAIINGKAISFWYHAGFRTRIPEIDRLVAKGDFRVSELAPLLSTHAPDMADVGMIDMFFTK